MRPFKIHAGGQSCSFCGVARPGRRMIVSSEGKPPTICDECIVHCRDILDEVLASLRPDDESRVRRAFDDVTFVDQLGRIHRGLEEERRARGGACLLPGRANADRCSFCRHRRSDVAGLVTGPTAVICTGCVVAAAYACETVKMRTRYGTLYDDLLAVFFRVDPIGINYETNVDEYAPEVRAIVPRLRECASIDDVVTLVHEVFVRFFGETLAGARSDYELVASEVWSCWQSRPSSVPES